MEAMEAERNTRLEKKSVNLYYGMAKVILNWKNYSQNTKIWVQNMDAYPKCKAQNWNTWEE